MNSNPGFRITFPMLVQAFTALVYGDLIMLLSNQTRPYEINKGDTDRLIEKWTGILGDCYERNRGYFWGNMRKKLFQIADDFAAIPVKRVPTAAPRSRPPNRWHWAPDPAAAAAGRK